MRIGIYDPYLDDLGGGEKYMMTIAQCLSADNEVSVFWDNAEDFSKLSERFGLDFTHVKRVDNIFRSSHSLIERFTATQKYDVIIMLSDGSIPFLGSKKLFLHVQQPLRHMQVHSLWSKIKLSRVTKFFCNSEYTKSYIGRHVAPKTTVIYPPVALFPQKIKKENVILHVGRFRLVDPLTKADDYKKQHMMIEAFAQMVKNGLTNWKFVLAVSVMDRDMSAFGKMKDLAKGLPIEFFVNKTNKELWSLYSKAKIYWHASGFGEDLAQNPEYAEHFGISTVEAMGAGAVPVVIAAGGQKEIVTDGVNGLLWSTLDELQEKTKRLTADAGELKKLSTNAQKRANDFSYEKFSQAVHKLLI